MVEIIETGASLSVTTAELFGRVEAILLKAGLHPVQAAAVTRVIVAAERDACKSHGVYRIEGILRTLKAGKVEANAQPKVMPNEKPTIVRVNAQGGFSNSAFELGAPLLADRAKEFGMASLVINDCTHFAALWPEIEALTDLGLAAMAMCPSYSTVAPTGGKHPLFGTNPFAFGWPRPGKNPYVFDFATSVAARGEVELHRRAGKKLPDGWAVDPKGEPTNDPEVALSGALLPFGGHKGSAISTMIELLAGVLIGDLTSSESLEQLGSTTLSPSHGELIIAFSPKAFARSHGYDPFARAEILFEAIMGQGARLPSQRRFAARANAEKHGIVLDDAESGILERMERLGLQS
jgi:delta1-piperideine-2-carboxylate reductase